MSNNNANTAAVNTESAETRKVYSEEFIPQVHRIGRSTMAAAFVLAFIPVLYFVFVKGYAAPLSSYVNVIVAVASIGIGIWLTEPLAYWPVLGSAGTYIGYLSGNVGAMRFPVALNLQSVLKADINTMRGQIVTIVGIVSSVVVNLALLLIFVLGGEWVLGILPQVVIASFAFVMTGLFGSMTAMRFTGEGGLVKNIKTNAPYFITAIVVKFISTKVSALSTWGIALSVGACILLAYGIYKNDCKKEQ